MAKKAYIGVGDKARKINGGYIGISGVARKLKTGYVGVNGVARQFLSGGIPLSQFAEGATVYINESGSPVAFYVAKHNYESGLNGAGRTLLVRANVYGKQKWEASNINAYATSDIDKWLNGTYKNKLDSATKTAIGTTIFYYTPGNWNKTISTLSRSVFLVSMAELTIRTSSGWWNNEGSALSSIAATIKSVDQWTRTPQVSDSEQDVNHAAMATSAKSNSSAWDCSASLNVSPCFTLPAGSLFDPATMQFVA